MFNAIDYVGQILEELQQRCEIEQQKILQDLEQQEQSMIITALPLFMRQFYLARDAEMITAQLDIIEKYCASPTAWTENTLNARYQSLITQMIEEAVIIFSDYVAGRDYVFREGHFIQIPEQAQKAEEIARFRAEFSEHVSAVYGQFRLKPTLDLEVLQKSLQVSLEMHQKEYLRVMEDYTREVSAKQAERLALSELLFQKQALLKKQKSLWVGYHPTLIEQLCVTGNLPGLQAELSKFLGSLDYLHKTAPNALHCACWRGSPEIIEFLLQTGISPEVADTFDTPAHYYPIHYVVMQENNQTTQACLELLKRHGAHFHIQEPKYGRNPLHTACLFGNDIAVQWLIQEAYQVFNVAEACAFINQSEQGPFQRNTPLHNAAYGGYWGIVEILLDNGADPTILNYTGNTPLMELLCSSMPRDSKVHGMILFHKRSRNYHLSQDNLAKLKKCIRPSFEQEILPVLFRIEGEEPHLLQFLDIHATEETTHNVLLFNQPPFGAVLPLMPEQKPIMEEDITGTIPNKCSCS